MRPIRTALLAAAGLLALSIPASAEFFGWRVTNVESWDVLNVRSEPTSSAVILVGYPNGTPLSLTGSCTGGLKLDDINGRPKFQQTAAVRYRWCEVWVDPLGDGNYQTGWVYGKYITPL
jgi:hypothetical protein